MRACVFISIYINKVTKNKIAYILQHLVSSHNEVIVSNKAGESCRRTGFHILKKKDGYEYITSTFCPFGGTNPTRIGLFLNYEDSQAQQ